ncbi:hypothetical protein J0H58_19400 [bacterium]|nr:hypothetical protein [bacterium]
MSATRAETYLTFPTRYADRVGGLRWAAGGDAVERWNGTTLALTEEIGAVLEGVFTRPDVPPFVVVLHVFHLMRSDDSSPLSARLRAAYRAAHGPPTILRNAGVLIAELCAGVPPAAGVPGWAEVDAARVRRRLFGSVGFPLMAEEPALAPAETERWVADRLAVLGDDELRHWFAHGCAPGTAGEKLAEEVESLPARVARLLALARKRPRLVGAAAVVPAVDAALTLPPRRRSPDAVPQGGYADVTTRGDPDRLLPSQFALDPDEFVRRFAERELLYFQREEPQASEKPDRLVVLDQGVRTWGPVRLGLAAAALVLLRPDPRRVGRVLLAATSADGVLDLAAADPEAVAAVLEASDLSASPLACWEDALVLAGAGPRDVILLTHPRTARDPALHAVARQPGDRVFALALGDDGRAELSEWGATGPVAVRSFRVDLAAVEAARVDEPARLKRTAMPDARLETAWTGDVEPIGFPFRPGLVGEPTVIAFDAPGEWLVTAGPLGVLHGLAFDGRAPEVLPRAFHAGAVLKQVDAVLGLNGGVAVCGRVDPVHPAPAVTVYPTGSPVLTSRASDDPQPTGQQLVVAYYDRAARRVTAHALGPALSGGVWMANPGLNCVMIDPRGREPHGIDLTTGERARAGEPGGRNDRLTVSLWLSARQGSPPFTLPVHTADPQSGGPNAGPHLVLKGNGAQVVHGLRTWQPFLPMRDGKPLLGGAEIVRTQLTGDVLALALRRRGRDHTLTFFQAPDGRVVGEVPHPHSHAPFVLSPDGRLVARLRPPRTLVVAATAGDGSVRATAAPAALHNNLAVALQAAPLRLRIAVGGFDHTFDLDGESLRHAVTTVPSARPPWPTVNRGNPSTPRYDQARFPAGEVVQAGYWRAVVDRLGQVLLHTEKDGLVAAFLVRRELAAAWLPGGVFWGSPALIGGGPTPDAARHVGAALASAWRRM